MKKIIFLIILLATELVCFGKIKRLVYTDTLFNNIEFEEIVFTINTKSEDTSSIKGFLAEPSIIHEIPCMGDIEFSKRWELRKFTLSADYNFKEIFCPKGTHIKLNEHIFDLDHHFAIRNSKIYRVNVCKFPAPQIIIGLICDSEEEVIFRTDWQLLACIIGEDSRLKGHQLKKGTFVRFDDDRICLYCLEDPIIQDYHCSGTNYNGKFWTGSTGINLYPDGSLKYFQPIDDVEIQGIYCKKSSVRGGIYLFENGQLKKCTLAKDQKISGNIYKENTSIEFDSEGKLIYAKKEKIF